MTLSDAIAELRRRNEPVPRPGRLPTAAEVAAAERELGVTFHPDLRRYLLEASDVVLAGTMEPATVTDRGDHTDLVAMAQAAWGSVGLPRELLPICADNGDYWCQRKDGSVAFWSHDGASDESYESLAGWIEVVWLGEAEG